jgi:hypothetical protein
MTTKRVSDNMLSFFSLARLKAALAVVAVGLGTVFLALVRKSGVDAEKVKQSKIKLEEAHRTASFNKAMAEHADPVSDKEQLVQRIREKGL